MGLRVKHSRILESCVAQFHEFRPKKAHKNGLTIKEDDLWKIVEATIFLGEKSSNLGSRVRHGQREKMSILREAVNDDKESRRAIRGW